MRRGVMAWDADELPIRDIKDRIARLQGGLRRAGLDGFLAYTNIARPAAVTYLTGFTPYWSEGLLFIPPAGEPVFATALSKRVADWIRTVMPFGAIANTPQPARWIASRLPSTGARPRIGVLELDLLPAVHAGELKTERPGLDLVDATELFNSISSGPDRSAARLRSAALAIAETGLDAADPEGATARSLVGAVERAARLARAEEVFVAIAPDLRTGAALQRVDTARELGPSFALRVSVAYKGAWVRRMRSFALEPGLAARFAEADRAMERCCASLRPGDRVPAPVQEAAASLPGASLVRWILEGQDAGYPLKAVASSGRAEAGRAGASGLVLSIELKLGDERWLGAWPTGNADLEN
jgi:Xaa-Pro aminopeptidase